MRTLKSGSLITVDGRNDDPQGWGSGFMSEAILEGSIAALDAADFMVMGRGTYEYLSPRWSVQEGPYMDALRRCHKLVFSSTLTETRWENSRIVPGDGVAAMRELKAEGDGDLVMYGYGAFARALGDAGLIDRYDVMVIPLLRVNGPHRLRLVSSVADNAGVMLISYEPEAPVARE